jgi:hypothetical protein
MTEEADKKNIAPAGREGGIILDEMSIQVSELSFDEASW